MTELKKLDAAAEAAMKAHRLFRETHWRYFYATNRMVDGKMVAPPVDRQLQQESMRLFGVAVAANKAALDFEYNLHYGKK